MFGRRETVAMSIINFIDNIRLDITFFAKYLFSKNLRKELATTKKLKNSRKGDRCFIVGNGPSLKHHDLTKLTDEFVFTVNYMMKSDDFKTLKSNCHMFFDPVVFGLNPKNEDDVPKIALIDSTLESNPDLTYIIPYRRRLNFMKLFPKHKFNFIHNTKFYTPSLKNASELHGNTPFFQNVIVYAINTAIYMGFKEIYLLGVDMTGFMENFEHNTVNDQWGHAYEKSEEEKVKITKFLKEHKIDNEFYLKTYGKTFEHLKTVQNNAIAKDVKLYNASQHGALDFIPRIDYKSLF